MRPHQKLDAWSKSVDLVVEVYKATDSFPKEERYGLTSQIRRAGISTRLTLQKVRGVILRRNLPTSCQTHKDQQVNLKPS
jgi:hypothetical protein